MSDEREPNNRSDAALRERLEIAGKATEGPWAFWEWENGVMEIRSHADPDEVHVCRVWHKEDGEFLRDNSPREVLADIEEILRLRAEVKRLEDMLAHLVSRSACQTVEGWWSAHGEKFQTKKEAMQHVITKAEDEMKEAARKAVEEEERHG